jgi:uncharacterized protein YchJ
MDSRGNLYRMAELVQRVGHIQNDEVFAEQQEIARRFQKEKLIALNEEQYQELEPLSKNARKNIMRNKPCICGSSKKFKKCCWGKFQ